MSSLWRVQLTTKHLLREVARASELPMERQEGEEPQKNGTMESGRKEKLCLSVTGGKGGLT